MAEVAAQGLDAAVPPCPGWTVRDALLHTAEVYAHKVACMRLGSQPEPGSWVPPDDSAAALDWFQAQLDELVLELTSRDPDSATYTWHDDHQIVGFWYRRMALETAVHRVDVESGFDQVSPVEDDLAVDGIDEILDWMLVFWSEDVGPDGPGRGTVLVRTGDHAWRVTLEADRSVLSREPGPSDAVVSGEPSELLLWLWGRRPDSAVQQEGDGTLIEAFRERLRIVTQ
jgi:uncharacterized protein (TIGR03083 family)